MHRDYDGEVAKTSLYPLPVAPAWGKGFLRDGFRRHLLGWYSAQSAFQKLMRAVSCAQERGMDGPPQRCPPAHHPAAVRRHGSIHRLHGSLSLHARKRHVLQRKASSAGGVHRRAEGGGRLGNNLDFSALVPGVHQVGL